MRPHTPDLWNSHRLQLIPDRARAVRAAIERIVIGRDPGNGAEQNGIVAIEQGLDADRRLLQLAADVVTGPFPEWSLRHQVVWMCETFEGNLGIRGYRQAGARAGNNVDRFADEPACD